MREKLKVHDGDTPGKVIEVKLEYLKPNVATMTDMKCPLCHQELNQDNPQSIECRNDDCKKSYFMYGSKELWKELIRTRKALDVAVDALKWIDETYNLGMGYEAAIMEKCELALEQITALEQKE